MKCMHCKSEWNVKTELSISVTKCPFCGKSLANEAKKLDTLESVLKEILDCFGIDALRNGKHLLAYFSDLAPDLKRDKLMLSYLVDCNGHTTILDAKKSNAADQKLCVEKVILQLSDEMLVDKNIARSVCYAFWTVISGDKIGPVAPKSQQRALDNQATSETVVTIPKVANLTPEEQFQKGEDFFNGLTNGSAGSKDYAKAFEWYSKAANSGHALAQCQLGLLYRDGKGVEKDEKQSFSWFMKASHASQNCPRGKFYVGSCYERGTGVSQDYKEAVRWYTIAAEQGDAYAQINLALCYKFGDGVEKNYAEAARLLSLAVNQGDALAQCHLGLLYKEGKGVQKDLDKAFQYISQSANQGESYGQLQLGRCYWRGEAVKRDPFKAFAWFKMAAEQGDEEAQERVGYCYEKGEGVNQDIAQAVYWYEEAANSGLASAMRILAGLYEEGQCVAQDYAKAVAWYRKAIAQGDSLAMVSLGDCFFKGKGVLQSEAQAMDLYEKAYSKGDVLGLMHIFEQYGNKNKMTEEECKKAVVLAQKDHDAFSAFLVKHLTDSLLNVSIDLVSYPSTKATGIAWIEKCAEAGSVRAQLWLGESYRIGDDLPKNKEKAIYWYEKAAAQGDQDAKDRLKLMKKGVLRSLFS